jgi:hypothetical protein
MFALIFIETLNNNFSMQLICRHYTHAYNNLLEIRIVDTNALEIRTVAGFINYKLCKLMFALISREMLYHNSRHILTGFKNRMGFQELSFEHYAWCQSSEYCGTSQNVKTASDFLFLVIYLTRPLNKDYQLCKPNTQAFITNKRRNILFLERSLVRNCAQ